MNAYICLMNLFTRVSLTIKMTGKEDDGCSEMYPCIDANSYPNRNAPAIVYKFRTTISGVISQ